MKGLYKKLFISRKILTVINKKCTFLENIIRKGEFYYNNFIQMFSSFIF